MSQNGTKEDYLYLLILQFYPYLLESKSPLNSVGLTFEESYIGYQYNHYGTAILMLKMTGTISIIFVFKDLFLFFIDGSIPAIDPRSVMNSLTGPPEFGDSSLKRSQMSFSS